MTWFTGLFMWFIGRFNWENVLIVVLQYAFKYLSNWLVEKELTRRAKMFVRLVYLLAKELGSEWAHDTSNTKIDDQLVKSVTTTCETIAEKFGFKLPVKMQ